MYGSFQSVSSFPISCGKLITRYLHVLLGSVICFMSTIRSTIGYLLWQPDLVSTLQGGVSTMLKTLFVQVTTTIKHSGMLAGDTARAEKRQEWKMNSCFLYFHANLCAAFLQAAMGIKVSHQTPLIHWKKKKKDLVMNILASALWNFIKRLNLSSFKNGRKHCCVFYVSAIRNVL